MATIPHSLAFLTEPKPQPGKFRARYAHSNTSADWVEVVEDRGTKGVPKRMPAVALARIALAAAPDGRVLVGTLSADHPVAGSGVALEFTNRSTGAKARVTLTANGTFPYGFELSGKAGDCFAVAASEGSDESFASPLGNIAVLDRDRGFVDLIPDPGLHHDELDSAGQPRFAKVNYQSQALFRGPPRVDQVVQGRLGNCYFSAAMAAMAKSTPQLVTKLITNNGDGTYQVTFKQKDWSTQRSREVQITVDADLYARVDGHPLYGSHLDRHISASFALWFPLMEKAYAQWKGSYHFIGNGGSASDVFEDFTGVEASVLSIQSVSPESTWEKIVALVDAQKPLVAGSFSEDGEARYTNTPIFANHAYAIMGYVTSAAGRKLTLSNPWGESVIAGVAQNGNFELEFEKFIPLFQTLYFQN